MKSRKLLVVGGGIAAVALTVVYFSSHRSSPERISASVAVPSSPSIAQRSVKVLDTSKDIKEGSGVVAKTMTLAERFREATDYRELVASLMDRAQNGDRDAQYYLSAGLRFCDVGYRTYFDRGAKPRRTLDEAMSHAAQLPGFNPEEARDVYNKCHTLKEGDVTAFGSAEEWLAASAAAGQPLAQATRAIDLFLQSNIALPDGTGSMSASGKDPSELRRSSIDLAVAAIKSKDPEVLWKIGDMQTLLTDSWTEANHEQWVWRLAACQRGFDCSAGATWYEFSCRFDALCQPGETGIDYIRRTTANDFESIQEEARQLNSNIDAGNWAALKISAAVKRAKAS